MRSNDTEFAAIKLPRCLMGGGRKWSEVDTVWFDETVAPSTRERSTTPGDRGSWPYRQQLHPQKSARQPLRTSTRQAAIALRTPEERLHSGAPKKEFGRMIFQKKSSLGDRTKVNLCLPPGKIFFKNDPAKFFLRGEGMVANQNVVLIL